MNIRYISYKLYEDFIANIYQIESNVSRNDRNERIMTNFLIELHKSGDLNSIGPEFIYNYLIYQFDRLMDKETAFGERVTFGKVFGKASLKKYQNKPKDFNWYNADKKVFQRKRVSISQFKRRSISNYENVSDVEEIEKSRFYNTEQGLANCLECTTLFNHRSSICSLCNFRVLCKKMLKENYYGIYVDRGYVREDDN